jgi:hypothetical protein
VPEEVGARKLIIFLEDPKNTLLFGCKANEVVPAFMYRIVDILIRPFVTPSPGGKVIVLKDGLADKVDVCGTVPAAAKNASVVLTFDWMGTQRLIFRIYSIYIKD